MKDDKAAMRECLAKAEAIDASMMPEILGMESYHFALWYKYCSFKRKKAEPGAALKAYTQFQRQRRGKRV